LVSEEVALALTQRSPTASTQPRKGQTPSAKTVSKLKKAMSGKGGQEVLYGVTLRQKAVAPDGGAPADYYKGWRFLPADVLMPKGSKTGDGSHQADPPYTLHEIMKDQTHVNSDRSKPIKKTSFGLNVIKALKDLHNSNGNNPKAQKIIDDAYHQLILAPKIKAQEEQLAKQREAKELEYATLKMRVQELEKRPTPTPTAPEIITSPTSYLPLAVVGIVIVVILLFLRRRA